MDDTQIIALFFARSEQAVSEAMKRYGSAVWKVSTNILKDRQDAEECYSDTFHAVWNQIPPNKPQFLGAYLCRIAKNLSLKRYESNTAQKRNGYYDVAMEELEDTIPALATVEQQYDAKELAEYLNRFLWGLSVRNVELVGLDYGEGDMVLEDDGNWYFTASMIQGTVADSFTAVFYDWDDAVLGKIEFHKA